MSPDRNPLQPARPMFQGERVAFCIHCGKELERSRSDRRFCSRVCAARFTKWRTALLRREKRVKRILAEIADYGSYPQFVDAEAVMSNLYKSVDYWTKIVSKRQSEALRALDADGQ